MKKIIATVLAMVMALALCSTAFAAPATVTAKAIMTTKDAKLVYHVGADGKAENITLTYTAAKAAKVNSDGKQVEQANVAYYTSSDSTLTGKKYAVVGSLAEADVVVYNNCTINKDGSGDASNVLMYLAETVGVYDGTGTVFTNFGTKCGQVNIVIDKDETYYTTNAKGDKNIYVTSDAATAVALMVGGKLVKVVPTGTTTADIVPHVAVPTYDKVTSKITGYTCSNCKMAAIEAPNYASIPAGAQIITGNWYFPAAAASTTTTTSSPKTFDAGIAMYVGMALTSVAGSAVVIGKKKEF